MEIQSRTTADLTPLEKVTNALVDLIRERTNETYFVDHFPDNLKSFDAASKPRLILVQYTGSRYGEPEDGHRGTQLRRADFTLHLQLTSSGEPVRGPAHIETIRRAVQGQRVQGGRIALIRDGLHDHDEEAGVWQYLVEVGITMPAVAMPPNAITPALMTKTRGA